MELKFIFIVITLYVISFSVEGCEEKVQLITPTSVVAGDDVKVKCVADGIQVPRVVVLGKDCNSKVEKLNVDEQNVNCGQVNFMVKNVNTSCTFRCFICKSRDQKTVTVVDAKIISPPSNITISENMPVRLNCTVKASVHLRHHKLVWLEGDAFVPSGDHHYSMSSSKFDYSTNTQDNFLVIRQATCPAAYTCALISASGKETDSVTHYVHVTETNSVVSSVLEYLAVFFGWNSKEIDQPSV